MTVSKEMKNKIGIRGFDLTSWAEAAHSLRSADCSEGLGTSACREDQLLPEKLCESSV